MSDHIERASTETMEAMRSYLDAQQHMDAGDQYGDDQGIGRAQKMTDAEVLDYMDKGGYARGAAGFLEDNGF